MKNGKIKLNKTKLIARVMLVVLLFSSALNLAGCTQNEDFDNAKRFNLNDGEIKFLCMSGSSYETRREVWDDGYCRGIYIVDGNETYERPYITYNSTIVDEDLGDGRTFYEKYIKKHLSFNGSYEYSMEIYASFYAFQDEVEILRYEFDSYYPKGEKIKIYNNEELVGIVNIITKLDMPKEFYTKMLDNTIFTITANKYLLTELGDVVPDENSNIITPSLNNMEFSYLTIRDLRNSNKNIDLYNYKSNFNGGYSSVIWQTEYEAVTNENKLDFYVPSLNAHIQLETKFYEYREKIGRIEYIFTSDFENENCIELYSNSVLAGKIYYSADTEISEDWLIDFFNENLVVISVKK